MIEGVAFKCDLDFVFARLLHARPYIAGLLYIQIKISNHRTSWLKEQNNNQQFIFKLNMRKKHSE